MNINESIDFLYGYIFFLGMNQTSANITLGASQRDSFSKAVTKNVIVVALGVAIFYLNASLIHTFHKHQVSCSSQQEMLSFKVTYNQYRYGL